MLCFIYVSHTNFGALVPAAGQAGVRAGVPAGAHGRMHAATNGRAAGPADARADTRADAFAHGWAGLRGPTGTKCTNTTKTNYGEGQPPQKESSFSTYRTST